MLENKISPIERIRLNNPDRASEFLFIWDRVVEILKTKLTVITVNAWLTEVNIISIENNNIILYVMDEEQMDIISNRYIEDIKSALDFVLSIDSKITLLSKTDPMFEAKLDKIVPLPAEADIDPYGKPDSYIDEDMTIPSGQDYEYTFENFIVGNSNRFAHAACVAIANTPASNYNPLFIYGGSGLGKTHLLYAIMHHIKNKFPSFKVVYLKGDDFTNELVRAIQNGKHMEFRSRYRYADLFLLDDIQFIAGKEMTQEEFFHTFNTLYEAKKQIVLTSDRPPKEIALLEERLRTRFEWGLLADIQPPDYETRMAIVQRKAKLLGIDLNSDIIAFICNNVKTNIRQLEGTVKKLKAFHQLTGTDINLAIAQNAVKDMFVENIISVITPEKVIKEIAEYYNLTPNDITGKKRTNEIAYPRQIAMYITRELTDLSLPAIGQAFGKRDHTTVLHSVKKIEDEMNKNLRQKQLILELMKNIKDK